MNILVPQALKATQRLEKLGCGKPASTRWLLHHASEAQDSGSGRTLSDCDQVCVRAINSAQSN